MSHDYDVAIIGGGPGGSTTGTFLKKHAPELKVAIFERERFPRDHIGESQLPAISYVLDEMGCWDRVEAAGFPIKVGATFKWGENDTLWDFEFIPASQFAEQPRPGKFKGQRTVTAFQVDRSIYDEILLDYAAEMGCEVFEQTPVRRVFHEGDRVTGIELEGGRSVEARYYIDASGGPAILRRTLGIGVEQPGHLMNVAFWDYWQNAEWAVHIGTGGTRIQVMSLPYGWLWFIPLGPTRTSLGLVCPAEYYKSTGIRPEELYRKAVSEEPNIAALIKNATCEGKFASTRDWSYVAERTAGENWFLVGEAAGFADPILSAGLSLTHFSGREVAFTIMELDRREKDGEWLRQAYNETQIKRVRQHIQFADYWYTAKGSFPHLKHLTRNIALEAGLDLDAEAAFRWIGTGGFVDHGFGVSGLGSFSMFSIKTLMDRFCERSADLNIAKNNVFKLDLATCEELKSPLYRDGRVDEVHCYRRGAKSIALDRLTSMVIHVLRCEHKIQMIDAGFKELASRERGAQRDRTYVAMLEALEALVRDGFVKAEHSKNRPLMDYGFLHGTLNIHDNVDNNVPIPQPSART
jgi:flavin-dependent dehydrogenase